MTNTMTNTIKASSRPELNKVLSDLIEELQNTYDLDAIAFVAVDHDTRRVHLTANTAEELYELTYSFLRAILDKYGANGFHILKAANFQALKTADNDDLKVAKQLATTIETLRDLEKEET